MRGGATLVVEAGASRGATIGGGGDSASSLGAMPEGMSDGGVGDGARFFTAREAARLMGFPESFSIPGHPDQAFGGKSYERHLRFYNQIGNSVCPLVVKAIAEPLLAALSVEPQSRTR